MLNDFYSAVAQVSFTLLGLWWLVLQTTWARGWAHVAARRRTSYHLSLYFMLPGVMSLMSLLSSESSTFWRLGFGASSIFGAIEALVFTTGASTRVALSKLLPYAAAILYCAIAVVAMFPGLVDLVGVRVTALHLEGALLSLLLFLGVNLAWMQFFHE